MNVEIFCTFEVRLEVTNILGTRDNVLHQTRTYLQKNESSIVKHNGKVFRNIPLNGYQQIPVFKFLGYHKKGQAIG